MEQVAQQLNSYSITDISKQSNNYFSLENNGLSIELESNQNNQAISEWDQNR